MFSFTQVDLVWINQDLVGIVIHKWVPVHGTHFDLRFCPAKSRTGTAAWPSIGIWLWALKKIELK